MKPRSRLALATLLILGCETSQTTPQGGDGGPLSPFSEAPFAPAREDDFVVDPAVGFPLSRRHVLVAFRATATEAAAAQAIRSVGGVVVGALGDARVAQVALPDGTTTADRLARLTRLAADPSVRALSEDMALAPTLVPPWRAGNTAWSWRDPANSVGNWSLRAMGMPLAWNLKPLLDPVRNDRRVEVAVIDSGFQRHGDLVPDVLDVTDAFLTDDPAETIAYHGTAVAGIIGARWDGFGTDGIAPFVRLRGAQAYGFDAESSRDPARNPLSIAGMIHAAWARLRLGASERPRLVNLSLGMNHYSTCYPRPGRTPRRCDPRQGTSTWGAAVPDSDCDGALVRQRLADAGAVFSQMVDAAQRGGDALFVVAAANDSGPGDGRDPCATGVGAEWGMGLFPARFASAMAAAGLIHDNPNVLVVEVVERNEDMRGPLRRAPYSNVGGHILAPGDGISSPRGGGTRATVGTMSGTSAATPHVTGAAAWLLTLNPRLGNPALRSLLLAEEGAAVEGTTTRARLFVPTSIARMEVAVPGVSARTVNGARLLADMDDGSPDGFSRIARDGYGGTLGPYTARRSPSQNAGSVDMADFRFLRDSALFYDGLTNSRCTMETPACDLNGDGVPSPDAVDERHPRALIVHQPPSGEGPSATENLRALAAHFDGDTVQGWRAEELSTLTLSADFEVFAGDFLTRAGATAVELTLAGNAPDPMHAPPRREPLTAVRVGHTPTVLTSPLTEAPSVTVRVVGGAHDGRVLMSRLGLFIGPGQSAVLFLNACALEPMSTTDIFAPHTPSCDPDAGVPPTDAAAFDTCSSFRMGTAPYVCFTLTGSSLPTTYSVGYPREGTAAFRGYYNTATGRTLVRMSGRPRVNGDFELVDVTFNTPGNGPSSERWPTNVKPSTIHITFSDGDILGGPGTLREFDPIPGADVSGVTTLTRYDAPSGLIEGTFSGVGYVTQVHPSSMRFEPVTLVGSFRVPRTPDS